MASASRLSSFCELQVVALYKREGQMGRGVIPLLVTVRDHYIPCCATINFSAYEFREVTRVNIAIITS